jgi:hypothetical protein
MAFHLSEQPKIGFHAPNAMKGPYDKHGITREIDFSFAIVRKRRLETQASWKICRRCKKHDSISIVGFWCKKITLFIHVIFDTAVVN